MGGSDQPTPSPPPPHSTTVGTTTFWKVTFAICGCDMFIIRVRWPGGGRGLDRLEIREVGSVQRPGSPLLWRHPWFRPEVPAIHMSMRSWTMRQASTAEQWFISGTHGMFHTVTPCFPAPFYHGAPSPFFLKTPILNWTSAELRHTDSYYCDINLCIPILWPSADRIIVSGWVGLGNCPNEVESSNGTPQK